MWYLRAELPFFVSVTLGLLARGRRGHDPLCCTAYVSGDQLA